MQLISGSSALGDSIDYDELEASLKRVIALPTKAKMLFSSSPNAEQGFTEAIAGGATITYHGGYIELEADGGNFAQLYNANTQYDLTKDIRLVSCAKFSALPDGAGSYAMPLGFGNAHYGDDNQGFSFNFDVTQNKFFATLGNAITGEDVEITGLTLTDWNIYEIIFTNGVNCVFKVNGAIVATLTTGLPTTGVPDSAGIKINIASTTSRSIYLKGVYSEEEL